jgi:hypothetical protein
MLPSLPEAAGQSTKVAQGVRYAGSFGLVALMEEAQHHSFAVGRGRLLRLAGHVPSLALFLLASRKASFWWRVVFSRLTHCLMFCRLALLGFFRFVFFSFVILV